MQHVNPHFRFFRFGHFVADKELPVVSQYTFHFPEIVYRVRPKVNGCKSGDDIEFAA
jgi:hypothetical protein